MNTRVNGEIHELTASELDIVTGGSLHLKEIAEGAAKAAQNASKGGFDGGLPFPNSDVYEDRI